MKEVCVVHLVRAANGIDPFRRFLESYIMYQGGLEHNLLIIFKGFDKQKKIRKYQKILTNINYIWTEVSDEGLDITAYYYVMKKYSGQFKYFCFLNSFSELLDPEWLKKLHTILCDQNVGLVGATGSWSSNRTNAFFWFFTELNRIHNIIKKKSYISQNPPTQKIVLSRGKKALSNIFLNLQCLLYFNSFPNYHIRTNAFMLSSALMQNIAYKPVKTKMHAYKFESGRISLTQQILNMKMKVLVVGKDGIGYDKESWYLSKTFWNYDQENLLIADNQTREYQYGSKERRKYLSEIAWGNKLKMT